MIVFDFPKGLFEYDPDLGFRCRAHYPSPDGTSTNVFGFNDRDYPLHKTPGTFRVLFVGDSFSWAGGREGNYAKVLERKFETHHGSHMIDFINAGYPMTHTGEQLAMLKKFGLQYNPDLVILGFFMGNDFVDADPYRKRIVFNGAYADIDKRHEHRILRYPFVFPCRSFWVVIETYQILVESRRARTEARSVQQHQPIFSENTYLDIERKRLDLFNSNSFREGRYQQNINYIFQSVSEMDDLLKARNTKLIVAIFPDEFQINRKLFERIVERFKLNYNDYDLNLGQNVLKSFLDSKGIRYLDLTDRFRAEGEKRDLYLLRDTHWNSAGIQLAADILFEDLARRIEKTGP